MSSGPKHPAGGAGTGSTWRPSGQENSSQAWTGSFTRKGNGANRKAPEPRRSRWPVSIVFLLLVGGIGLWLGLSRASKAPASKMPAAVVELVRGPVMLRLDDSSIEAPTSARVGMELPAGAIIETGNESSGLSLRLTGGSSVRVDAQSEMTLSTADTLELKSGALYVDSRRGLGPDAVEGDPVEIRTTFGLVRDTGTQFEVRWVEREVDQSTPEGHEMDLRIRVREGQVLFTNTAGIEHPAAAGEQLSVGRDGNVTRASVPIYGPHWRWVLATAPVPDVEGRPMSIFLDWLEREGGWELAYEGSARETARQTQLFGNLRGLSADEATPTVFAGSGLVYRVEGSRLLVSQRPTESN